MQQHVGIGQLRTDKDQHIRVALQEAGVRREPQEIRPRIGERDRGGGGVGAAESVIRRPGHFAPGQDVVGTVAGDGGI